MPNPEAVAPLFRPFSVGRLTLPNRIVMAPMTRAFSPEGVPGPDVAAYYRRRAEGGVGLIITEGTWIQESHASNDPNVPRFYGDDALAGWSQVLKEVHAAGGKIMPQLWHVGISRKPSVEGIYGDRGKDLSSIGPSGFLNADEKTGEPMSQTQIDAVSQAYVDAAETAFRLGFDGVELHGAHGYLIDQFFWHVTNRRDQPYGGDIAQRTRFAADIVRDIRRRTAPGFPIILRFSQWKLVDYGAKLVTNTRELEQFLSPLTDAGVDVFHCSQRRFWEPEFEGSALNLAGWTKKISGRPTITVGSVSLSEDTLDTMVDARKVAQVTSLDELLARLGVDEFDLVAVGRALLTNPDWANKVAAGRSNDLQRFTADALFSLA